MQKFFTLFFFLFIASTFAVGPYVGPEWQAKSAREKAGLIYKSIIANDQSGPWPNALELAQVFIESMNRTFDTVQDQMPQQGPFDLQLRKKLVHSVGAVGFGRFVVTAASTNYTGIFKTGSNETFFRFSLAANPASNAVTPGLAVKFMRNGVPSANIFGMYRLTGQEVSNFFAHDLTNHVPDITPDDKIALSLLKRAFAKASRYPSMLGLTDAARFDNIGREYKPVFPYRLIFHPTSKLHRFCPNSGDVYSCLERVEPQVIYDVYVQDVPYSNPRIYGYFQTSTPLTSSSFGDLQLFYEHSRQERDFDLKPEWVGPTEAMLAYQRSHQGYAYPDLPWN